MAALHSKRSEPVYVGHRLLIAGYLASMCSAWSAKGRVLEDQWDRKRPREEGGHPERIPHDYRRAAARKLIRAGLPRSVAETLAGHKTDSVFDRYYIVDEVRLVEAGYRREALYDSRPSQNRHNQSTGGLIETISLYARGGVQTRTGGNSQGI